MDAGLQNKYVSGLVRNQHQFCSHRIVLTPKSYFLRPETRHRPHQSSQHDAFLSQARDQCFTRLAKMRRNTVTYWTTADFASRENCSFIRLNDAFRKTLLQVAKKTCSGYSYGTRKQTCICYSYASLLSMRYLIFLSWPLNRLPRCHSHDLADIGSG